MENLNTQFMKEIADIKDPIIFFGIARMMEIKLIDDESQPKDFCEMFEDIIIRYNSLARKLKREILKILRQANKEEKTNANRTENSKETISNENLQ